MRWTHPRFFAATLASASLLACSGTSTGPNLSAIPAARTVADGGTAAAQAAVGPFESNFMSTMVDHQTLSNEMARVCQSNGVRAELQQLCFEMRRAGIQDIATLQARLRDWYGIDKTPSAPGSTELVELNGLQGAAFERRFLLVMSRQHRVAVGEANRAVQHPVRPELLPLAERLRDTNRAEIGTMERWECDWFRACS